MNLLNFDYDKTALHTSSIFIVTIKTDSACTQFGILVAPQDIVDNRVEVSGESFCLSKPAIPWFQSLLPSNPVLNRGYNFLPSHLPFGDACPPLRSLSYDPLPLQNLAFYNLVSRRQ